MNLRSDRLADQCATHLRELLLDGDLTPGASIPIDSIARDVGASRQPVMEAVRALAADGLIEVRAQVGCRVAAVPLANEVADVFAIFARAEAEIAALAAARRSPAEADDLARLAAGIEAQGLALIADRYRGPAYRRLNRQLHDAIHDLARSPLAAGIVNRLWDRADFTMRAAFGGLYFTRAVVAGHRRMARAVVDGDAEGARAAAFDYLDAAGRATVAELERANP